MDRHRIAAIFAEMAALLELTDANPFRVRAYQNAARVVEGMSDLEARAVAGTLTDMKGIGDGIAAHINELLATGDTAEHAALRKKIPAGVLAMTQIPGVGPKKAKILWKSLKVTTLEELAAACTVGKVAVLPHMGEKTQQNILQGLAYLRKQHGQHLFPAAWGMAQQIVTALQSHGAVLQMEIAGSLRRRKEIVRDIDVVVGTKDPESVMQAFTALDSVMHVIARGETKSSVMFDAGVQADLRCVTPTEFPYALHHFTGSKEHNTAMRARAQQRGMKMNEYGLFRIQKSGERLIPCNNEAAIFAALELDDIPPELREDAGEIVAAETHTLPTLLEPDDLCGIFHCHTTYSDGKATLEDMVAAARARKYAYIGISDHSQTAAYAGGLTPQRVQAQAKEIDRLQKKFRDIRIFKGIESDILKDGSLDYSDEMLKTFDFVIASIHSNFNMTRAEMTARVCKALRHPATRILAHPTGRLLLSRESFDVDMDAVLREAAKRKVVVEINANPRRLELDWRLGRAAQQYGVRTMINPDAHSVEGIGYVEYGVGIARKGWWTARDVVNTWSLGKVEQWLAK